MTTSGVTSLTLTARDVITFALRKLGLIPIGQEPDSNELAPLLLDLNMMVKGWEIKGPHLWRNTLGQVPITPNTQSYSLASDNPLRIVECRYRYPDGHDLPMHRFSRILYMNLPLKNSAGFPTQYYFDPQENSQTLYVWPVIKSPTTDSLVYTFQRRFQICVSPNDSLDIVQEWLETVGYCLARKLLPNYGVGGEQAQDVRTESARLEREAKAFDRPASVQFLPEYRPRR